MDYFFNNTSKSYKVAIGKFLNSVYVQRFTSNGAIDNSFKVPIVYSPKLHWYLSKYDTVPQDYNIKKFIPIISYSRSGMVYDNGRQYNKNVTIKTPKEISILAKAWCQQATPWNFDFSVSVWTRTEDDMDQILEQLLYRFNPSHNLHVNEVPIFGVERTCRLKLSNVADESVKEFDIKGDRVLKYTLGLSIEGNIYPTINSEQLIQWIRINWHAGLNPLDRDILGEEQIKG